MFLKKVFAIFLLILSIGLLGCVPNEETHTEGIGLSTTVPVPVTRPADEEDPTAIPSLIPSPMPTATLPGLDDVRCGDLKDGIEEKSYWVDDMIPGESTYDEALQVIDELLEEEKPILLDGEAGFFSSDIEVNYRLIFSEGVLLTKEAPRSYLGEIINYYGDPVQVSWEVQTPSGNTYPGVPVEAIDRTTLFFPQSNALFWAEGQITYFSADTIFFGIELTPFLYEEFYTEINSKVSSSKKFVQHFPWPCS